jgi:hypothetical protein
VLGNPNIPHAILTEHKSGWRADKACTQFLRTLNINQEKTMNFQRLQSQLSFFKLKQGDRHSYFQLRLMRSKLWMATLMIWMGAIPSAIAQPTPTQIAPSPYPPEIVNAYMEGCAGNDSTKTQFCSCSINQFQQTIPLESFLAISASIQEGSQAPLPQVFYDAITVCISQESPANEPASKPIGP